MTKPVGMMSVRVVIFVFVFYALNVVHISAQYNSADFVSSAVISDGINAPGRMAIDADDNIYVTDVNKKNIIKYNANGTLSDVISTSISPLSIAINSENQIFVGDKQTGNIYTVDQAGNSTLFFTGTSLPNSMVFGDQNILFVVDS
ncbi:MAG: hypothetical protein OEX02_17970, partial [Cyclobacteriaceae bacterium]|nr:hypothetical protein [Cyclobacteriaceae bacterium]